MQVYLLNSTRTYSETAAGVRGLIAGIDQARLMTILASILGNPDKDWGKQFQGKWEPAFRPELRLNKEKEGFR